MVIYGQYVQRYCNPRATQYGMDYTGSTCVEELNYILNKTMMIRRLKKNVLTQLPSKTRQKIPVALDPELYEMIHQKLQKTFQKRAKLKKFVKINLEDKEINED